MRSVIGDHVSVIVQNSALLLVACCLSLVLIVVFPVVVDATVLQKMFMKGFSRDLEAAHAWAMQIAGEAVANMHTVVVFNAEGRIIGLFAAGLEAPSCHCFWKGHIAGSGFGMEQFSLYASYALNLWYAAWLIKHDISNFSNTIRIFMTLMVSTNGAAETFTLAPDFIKGGCAMHSVFDLVDCRTVVVREDPSTVEIIPNRLRGDVELKHVDFTYPLRPTRQCSGT